MCSALGGRAAYVATRDPDNLNMQSNTITFPEGLVNGHNIKVRFRIGTDVNTGEYGWLIDDVVVTNAIEPMFSEVVVEDNVCLSANAPVVNAGDNINVKPSDANPISINLTGTASDADGDALTVEWTQRSGPTVTINNANSLAADFIIDSPLGDVDMTFELSVSDGTQVVSDIMSVTITLNRAPTVTAIGSSVTEGESASLTATATDVDGDQLSYLWTQTSGANVTLTGADTANASFTAPQVEATTTFAFEVVVSDGLTSSQAATAIVTVSNTVKTGSGGGGGVGYLLLAIVGIIINTRRRQK